ncbi:MAG: hypothetical protein ABFC57_02155 [Veillonellales bacterium]
MASPEKMIKAVLEEIHQDTAPIAQVVQNQDILIVQNKTIIDLLQKIYALLEIRE